MVKGKAKIGGGGRLEEIRRTARILDIVQHIAVAPGRWTRKSLAAKYEVSERQIQKDFEIIRNRLNLDLRHDDDGYFFKSLPKLPTVSYSFSEALSILMAARVAQTNPGINSSELSSAIARLESLFPAEALPLLREAIDQIWDLPFPGRRNDLLTVLHRAIAERSQVRLVYSTASRKNELSERVVDPYRLVPYMGIWQLVAYCHSRKEVLEFNVDRISKADLLDSNYEVPADFNLDSYFGGVWGVYRQKRRLPEDIVLEFEPEAGRWVNEGLWHPSRSVQQLANGRVSAKLHITVSPDFISWLMHFGWRVKVIKPDWLKKSLAAEHKRAAGIMKG